MLQVHEWLARSLGGGGSSKYRSYAGGIRARLDLNEVPFSPSPAVLRAVSEEAVRLNRYPEPELRRVLEERLAEYSRVSPDSVVVGCGADLILYYVFYSVALSGDEVVVPYPAFFAYDKLFASLGLRVRRVQLREEGEWWRLDTARLLEEIRRSEKLKLVVIDNPNNPTGSLIVGREGDAVEIVEEAARRGALVVFDEAYYEFSGVTFAGLVDSYDNIVIVRTMSKAFALAGARIGYAIAPRNLASLLRKLLPPFPPRLSLVAGLAALEDLDYSRRLVETVVRERERVRALLNSLPGVKAYASKTNFLLVRTPVNNVVSQLYERGIAVREVPLGDTWMRVSVGSREENDYLLDAMRRLVGSG